MSLCIYTSWSKSEKKDKHKNEERGFNQWTLAVDQQLAVRFRNCPFLLRLCTLMFRSSTLQPSLRWYQISQNASQWQHTLNQPDSFWVKTGFQDCNGWNWIMTKIIRNQRSSGPYKFWPIVTWDGTPSSWTTIFRCAKGFYRSRFRQCKETMDL